MYMSRSTHIGAVLMLHWAYECNVLMSRLVRKGHHACWLLHEFHTYIVIITSMDIHQLGSSLHVDRKCPRLCRIWSCDEIDVIQES